jgi:hypothetical protein
MASSTKGLFGLTRFSFGDLRPELHRCHSIFGGFNSSFGVPQFFSGAPAYRLRASFDLSGMIFHAAKDFGRLVDKIKRICGAILFRRSNKARHTVVHVC